MASAKKNQYSGRNDSNQENDNISASGNEEVALVTHVFKETEE